MVKAKQKPIVFDAIGKKKIHLHFSTTNPNGFSGALATTFVVVCGIEFCVCTEYCVGLRYGEAYTMQQHYSRKKNCKDSVFILHFIWFHF
jgi:hypothetical protein